MPLGSLFGGCQFAACTLTAVCIRLRATELTSLACLLLQFRPAPKKFSVESSVIELSDTPTKLPSLGIREKIKELKL